MRTRASRPEEAPIFDRWASFGLASLVFIAAFALRLWAGRDLPLWFDESWTGMIVTQPNWTEFWREVWLDCNPPLYYFVMTLWASIFGASDIALRLPGLIFTTAAALLPLIWPIPGLRRPAGIVWALLLYLWYPGFEISVEARCYGLLLLLSVAQLIAFNKLIVRPALREAWIWAGLASLAALTHYHALLIAGLQGVALLVWHRKKALGLWPAALAFAPAFGWLAIHAPRLADYARPDVAWYEPMTLKLAVSFVQYAMGWANSAYGFALCAAVLGSILSALVFRRGKARTQPATSDVATKALHLSVLLCLGALAVELSLAFARPILTDRYLVPLVPGILLGLVMIAEKWDWKGPGLVALVPVYGVALGPHDLRQHLILRTEYSYQAASEFLRKHDAKKIVFAWDHRSSWILDRGSMAKLGGFFFARSGHPVAVTIMVLRPGDNANILLQKAAGETSGVVWIYNRARLSSARDIPPNPLSWGNRACNWQHGSWVGTFACAPAPR